MHYMKAVDGEYDSCAYNGGGGHVGLCRSTKLKYSEVLSMTVLVEGLSIAISQALCLTLIRQWRKS